MGPGGERLTGPRPSPTAALDMKRMKEVAEQPKKSMDVGVELREMESKVESPVSVEEGEEVVVLTDKEEEKLRDAQVSPFFPTSTWRRTFTDERHRSSSVVLRLLVPLALPLRVYTDFRGSIVVPSPHDSHAPRIQDANSSLHLVRPLSPIPLSPSLTDLNHPRLLMIANSLTQLSLCGIMWGLNRFTRYVPSFVLGHSSHSHHVGSPAWSTATLIVLSFGAGVVAAILIWKTSEATKVRSFLPTSSLPSTHTDSTS